MKTIYVCSRFRGDVNKNKQLAKEYCKEIISCGFLPIAPHIYFTEFMDDNNKEERELAFKFNKLLIDFCDELWVYGQEISQGMLIEINYAKEKNKRIKYKEN